MKVIIIYVAQIHVLLVYHCQCEGFHDELSKNHMAVQALEWTCLETG
jgi:hypothetical protein